AGSDRLDIVVDHESRSIRFDFAPDIHLVGDENWSAQCHCFGDNNAEILLMRRQRKKLRRSERPPFCVAAQHARPKDAVGNAEVLREFLKVVTPACLIWTSDHEVEFGVRRRMARESSDEEIDPFFWMNAA